MTRDQITLTQMLADAERQALADEVAREGGTLDDLHRVLAQQTPDTAPGVPPSAGALGSVAARLKLGWGDTFERGRALMRDHQARVCIRSTPPIVLANSTRGSKLPEVEAGSASATTAPFSDLMSVNLLPFFATSTA